jgi:hypothetical protein
LFEGLSTAARQLPEGLVVDASGSARIHD